MTEDPDTATTVDRRARRRKSIIVALAVAVSVGLLELVAAGLVLAVGPLLDAPIPRRGPLLDRQSRGLEYLLHDSTGLGEIHPVLGWRYRPGYAVGPDTLNAVGLRTSREYAPVPSEGTPRVAAFGDSFVYCNEVANPDCWSSILEASWNVEVLNYGVGGYGTDQAFLRYVEVGQELSPEVVIIGFAPVDLRRVVNRYRGFIDPNEGPWYKPRFMFSADTLVLIPTPVGSRADAERLLGDPLLVTEIGDLDQWYDPAIYEHGLYRWSATYRLLRAFWSRLDNRYFGADRLVAAGVFRTQSEAFRLQVAVMSAFADSVRARGSRPVVLMLPSRNDLERHGSGDPPVYAPLGRELARRGLEVVDPLEGFFIPAVPLAELFRPGGHYSRAGSEVVAREIAAFLSLDRP